MARPTKDSVASPDRPLQVRVPASSANLGPGFDVMGMALTLYAELCVVGSQMNAGMDSGNDSSIPESHPGMVAFRAAGGQGVLSVRCPIPSGRGLGFSGAVRVGGVCLGLAQNQDVRAEDLPSFIVENHHSILRLAAELEGHGDNVAASLHGGVTAVVADDHGGLDVTRVPVSAELVANCSVLVWVPNHETSTAKSRTALAREVDLHDAVFNIGHVVRLTVALASGDRHGLASTLHDRLHQDRRLAKDPLGQRALETMVAAGGLTGWLSGSGPTVAVLCDNASCADVERALDADRELAVAGRVLRLGIDCSGLQAA